MASLAAAWERRYAMGGDSGAGSTGEPALRKAGFVNALTRRERIRSVVDWGCGDGGQLALLRLPPRYVGVDISSSAVARCRARFPRRRFIVCEPLRAPRLRLRADLALSMDVIFHQVDDADFTAYMAAVFHSATRFVCVHSTDDAREPRAHMHHRHWTPYVEREFPDWQLVERTAETGEAFFVYRRRA